MLKTINITGFTVANVQFAKEDNAWHAIVVYTCDEQGKAVFMKKTKFQVDTTVIDPILAKMNEVINVSESITTPPLAE